MKQIKLAGFYKEYGPPKLPSIYSFIKNDFSGKRKMSFKIKFYLENCLWLAASSGESFFDNKEIGAIAIVTDGYWIWDTSIIYHYEHHGVDLPFDFEQHIRRQFIFYPFYFKFRNFLSKDKIKKVCDDAFNNHQLFKP